MRGGIRRSFFVFGPMFCIGGSSSLLVEGWDDLLRQAHDAGPHRGTGRAPRRRHERARAWPATARHRVCAARARCVWREGGARRSGEKVGRESLEQRSGAKVWHEGLQFSCSPPCQALAPEFFLAPSAPLWPPNFFDAKCSTVAPEFFFGAKSPRTCVSPASAASMNDLNESPSLLFSR